MKDKVRGFREWNLEEGMPCKVEGKNQHILDTLGHHDVRKKLNMGLLIPLTIIVGVTGSETVGDLREVE